jgi:acetyl-CoA carboxylase beta subunit
MNLSFLGGSLGCAAGERIAAAAACALRERSPFLMQAIEMEGAGAAAAN